VKNIPGLVQAWLGIFGVLGGPVLGIYSLGMFLPWANSKGALTGRVFLAETLKRMIKMYKTNRWDYFACLHTLVCRWW